MTRTSLAVLIALSIAAVPTPAMADSERGYAGPGDPWAIGYGMQVARSCPNWRMEPQRTLAERGILPRIEFGSGLMAMDGPFGRELYLGQGAAEADRRAHPAFCTRLRRIAGPRWARLARVVIPVAG